MYKLLFYAHKWVLQKSPLLKLPRNRSVTNFIRTLVNWPIIASFPAGFSPVFIRFAKVE